MHKQSVPFMTLLLALAALSAPGVSAAANDGTCEPTSGAPEFVNVGGPGPGDCLGEGGLNYLQENYVPPTPSQVATLSACLGSAPDFNAPECEEFASNPGGDATCDAGTQGVTNPTNPENCISDEGSRSTADRNAAFGQDTASNTENHVSREYYTALEENGLPSPTATVVETLASVVGQENLEAIFACINTGACDPPSGGPVTPPAECDEPAADPAFITGCALAIIAANDPGLLGESPAECETPAADPAFITGCASAIIAANDPGVTEMIPAECVGEPSMEWGEACFGAIQSQLPPIP